MNKVKKIPAIVGIYKITSPTDKIYIGQSIDIEERRRKYKNLASNIRPQIGIYNSLKKHGFESHQFDIIEECELKQLNERERYWQEYYNVLENGLNCLLVNTGDKPIINSEETKLRKSLAAPTRPIKQYTLKGEFIQDWKRIIDVERTLGIHNQTITKCCQGSKDSAGGFIWRYQDSPEEQLENIKPVHSFKYGIPVIQYDLNNNFIKRWDSASKASIELKIDGGSISNCCQNKIKTCGGFKWKYENQ